MLAGKQGHSVVGKQHIFNKTLTLYGKRKKRCAVIIA